RGVHARLTSDRLAARAQGGGRMTPAKVFVRRVTFALSLILMVPVAAWAQGYPRSVHFDPSVRAAGMAGSSHAVFWGGDTNDWSKPALPGYQSGFLYRWSHTPLIPEIASDIKFDSNRASYGWGGIRLGWSRPAIRYRGTRRGDRG